MPTAQLNPAPAFAPVSTPVSTPASLSSDAHNDTRATAPVLVAIHTMATENDPILHVATRLAKTLHVPLTAMSVIEPTTLFPSATGLTGIATNVTAPPSAAMLDSARDQLIEAVVQTDRDYAPGAPLNHTLNARIEIGDPEYEIASAVATVDVGALVIGRSKAHRRGGVLLTLLEGMRSARICETANVPVVSIAQPADGSDPLQTIVIATDFSERSWDAAVTAVRAAPANARIYVVHILRDASPTDRIQCESLRAALNTWTSPLSTLLSPGASLAMSVLAGNPYPVLAEYLTTVNATCVAVGGHRPRYNMITAVGYTLPERLLASWRGSLVIKPVHEPN